MVDEMYCPRLCKNDVLSRKVGTEIVICDPRTTQAFCLDETMTVVWEMSDGKKDVKTLLDEVRRAGYQDASIHSVWAAIDRLDQAGLLEETGDCESNSFNESRREMLRLLGRGAVAVLPTITAISIPSPVAAASPCLPKHAACFANSQCCSGRCLPSGKCQ